MSNATIATTVLLCINIMLYLGGYVVFDGDIMHLFFSIDDDNKNIVGFSKELNDSLPSSTLIAGQSEGGLEASPSDFRLTDIPKTLFLFFKFLFNVFFAPIALFTFPGFNFPVEIKLMMALPLTLVYIFLLINWWRGND